MRIALLLTVFMFFFLVGIAQEISIIPQPVSIEKSGGYFNINKQTVLLARDATDIKSAKIFNDYLFSIYHIKLPVNKKASRNYIRLTTKKFIRAPDKDGYNLSVTITGIEISGDTYPGTFYGLQSLIQLLPVEKSIQLKVPCVVIADYPRFGYRGMHLDVGRHFMPVSFVKKYIDLIALHKMNYLHWHLTEDQGWRIAINKYPLLTKKGAYRNGTIIGHNPGTGNDNMRYGGFYTQHEIKEVVQYAADRQITVIPEIEMPGHSSAAIAAYPWLSCFPAEKTVFKGPASTLSVQAQGKLVQEGWGVFEDVFCAGNDSTFLFLENVLDEVMTMFPSKYIHIGGDECPKTNWQRCAKCQQRMKDLGLKDEHSLQSYFIQRIEKYLNSKGKSLIGWDEILEGGLAPNAIVMSWRGEDGGIAAAKENHQVIMTPGSYVYFDHSQNKQEDSLTIGGFLPLDKVYNYEPVPAALDAEKGKYILGAQANVWTEYMAYPAKVEYMIFPRMSALAEVLWTPAEKKNWQDFQLRMIQQTKRYQLWNVNYNRKAE